MAMLDSTEAYCLFCYKSFEKSKREDGNGNNGAVQSLENEQSKGLQSRFFRLLNRQLQENKTSSLTKLKLKEFELENVLLQCPDCSSLLKSYCDYFEEIEVLKLKLNWRLGMLVKIVNCSGKVKSRRTCFEQKIRKRCQGFEEGIEAVCQDPVEPVKRLKKELVHKCKRILRSGPPQVMLQKHTEHRVLKLEEGRETDQVNSRSSSVLNGSGDFESEQTEENYVARVKIENGQHSSPDLSTCPIQSTFTAEPVEGDTGCCQVAGEAKAGNEPKTSGKGGLKLEGDDDGPLCSGGPSISSSSTADSEKNLSENENVTRNHDPKGEAMSTAFEEVEEVDDPMKVVDSDCLVPFSGNDEISTEPSQPQTSSQEPERVLLPTRLNADEMETCLVPELALLEEQIEEPLAPAEIGIEEHCSGKRMKVPEPVGDHEAEESSNAILQESDQIGSVAEPEAVMSMTSESADRRFSLRTRHKCPKCSVGFTSAVSLKVHLDQCGEPEATLDKDNDYDELGGSDNWSEDDDDDEDAAISESDSSHLSEAESDTGPDEEGESGSGRKRKFTTPTPVPKRSKCEFFETKLKCKVEDCKFYFYQQSDLENHSKLHGEFKCAFCDVTETYAPDLSVHELSHKVKLELGRNGLAKDEQSVQCPRCTSEVKFGDLNEYSKHHLEAHLNLTPNMHSCPVCECSFHVNKNILKSNVIIHFRAYHDVEGVPETEVKRCHHDGCSAYFLALSQLARHRLTVHIEGGKDNWKGPFICNICAESLTSRYHLVNHRINVHKVELPVPCDEPRCTRRFENELYMNQHLGLGHYCCSSSEVRVKRVEGPRRVFRRACFCFVCGSSFRTTSKLNRHLDRVHPNHRPGRESDVNDNDQNYLRGAQSQCLICNAPLKIGGDRKPHKTFLLIRNHFKRYHDLKGRDFSSPSVLKCNVGDCKAYFLRHSQLMIHQKRSHFDGKYKCASCDFSSKNPHNLRHHRVMAHKVKLNLACSHEGCEERCETQADLDLHMDVVHARSKTLKALVCETCGKRCHLLSSFKLHLKSHAPKEPYTFICPECGKVFLQKYKLQTHLLCHAGPGSWQFTCETCGKKCMTKQKLEEHQNVHSKAKSFTCEHCGLKYAHRHNLRHHLKDKHGVILEKVHWNKTTISVAHD